MDPYAAANAYKVDAIESAPPIKILRMLLQGALRFIERAARADAQDPQSAFVESVDRADAIVTELRCALDSSVDPQFCASLEQLYLFVETRLQSALAERDSAPLEDARQVLATLLETWSELELDQPTEQLGGALDAA